MVMIFQWCAALIISPEIKNNFSDKDIIIIII